jgi:hypothetical protein
VSGTDGMLGKRTRRTYGCIVFSGTVRMGSVSEG